MANNPDNRKLSSQFGDITGPSESELADIESKGEESWYTPERIEAMRDEYAKVDPNYAVVRNSRKGRNRGGGGVVPNSIGGAIETGGTFDDYGSGFGDTKASADTVFGRVSDAVLGESSRLSKTGEMSAGEGSAATAFSQGDEPTGRGRRFGGSGMAGWDVEAGTRASSFDRIAPRAGESQAKEQGLFYMGIAGPTCNHPICSAYRARGVELMGRYLGTDRALRPEDYGTAQHPEQAIPSVRKDKKVAPMDLRPESADVPVGKRKGSFGTGERTDYGDFRPNQKNQIVVPNTEVMDTNHPKYKALLAQYRKLAGMGERPLFHPDDYLEHHHAPGEEYAKLPWE